MYASRMGAPLMIANETRTILEQMQSRYSSAKHIDELAILYPALARLGA